METKRQKMEGQSGVKRKKVIKRFQDSLFHIHTEATRVNVPSCVVCTYVFQPHSIRTSDLRDKLCSIEANLNDVVEQSERWRQWERGHEQRHEPVLDYCKY